MVNKALILLLAYGSLVAKCKEIETSRLQASLQLLCIQNNSISLQYCHNLMQNTSLAPKAVIEKAQNFIAVHTIRTDTSLECLSHSIKETRQILSDIFKVMVIAPTQELYNTLSNLHLTLFYYLKNLAYLYTSYSTCAIAGNHNALLDGTGRYSSAHWNIDVYPQIFSYQQSQEYETDCLLQNISILETINAQRDVYNTTKNLSADKIAANSSYNQIITDTADLYIQENIKTAQLASLKTQVEESLCSVQKYEGDFLTTVQDVRVLYDKQIEYASLLFEYEKVQDSLHKCRNTLMQNKNWLAQQNKNNTSHIELSSSQLFEKREDLMQHISQTDVIIASHVKSCGQLTAVIQEIDHKLSGSSIGHWFKHKFGVEKVSRAEYKLQKAQLIQDYNSKRAQLIDRLKEKVVTQQESVTTQKLLTEKTFSQGYQEKLKSLSQFSSDKELQSVITQTEKERGRIYRTEYTLSPAAEKTIQNIGYNSTLLTSVAGNTVQQHIHSKIVATINNAAACAELHVDAQQLLKDSLNHALVAQELNHQGELTLAYLATGASAKIFDFAKSITDIGIAAGTGVLTGLDNVGKMGASLAHAVTFPEATLEHLKSAAESVATFFKELFPKGFDDASLMQWEARRVERSKALNIFLRDLEHRYKSASVADKVKALSTFFTENFLLGEVLSPVLNSVKAIGTEAQTLTKTLREQFISQQLTKIPKLHTAPIALEEINGVWQIADRQLPAHLQAGAIEVTRPQSQLPIILDRPVEFADFDQVLPFKEVLAFNEQPFAQICIDPEKAIAAGLKPEHADLVKNLRLDFMHCCFPELHRTQVSKKLIKITGLHWDPNGSLEKSGLITIERINNNIPFPEGFYKAKVTIEGRSKISTFFPKNYTAEQLGVMVQEAFSTNNIVSIKVEKGNNYSIKGVTNDGISIGAYWDPQSTSINTFYFDSVKFEELKNLS